MRPEEYATMYRVEERHWFYRALHRLILGALDRYLPDWRSRPILDAGCGTGAILQRLGNPTQNIGVDLAPEAIACCRQRGLNNVQQADVTSLPFPDSSFAAVISSSVLYHQWIKDVGAALRESHRVLSPDGLLFLNLPAFQFLHSAHDDAVMTARRFTAGEVRQVLQENGFQIEWLTYWITLLFPLAVIARTFHASGKGRDFEATGWSNWLFNGFMRFELALLKIFPMPFGVAIFAVARKNPNESAPSHP